MVCIVCQMCWDAFDLHFSNDEVNATEQADGKEEKPVRVLLGYSHPKGALPDKIMQLWGQGHKKAGSTLIFHIVTQISM